MTGRIGPGDATQASGAVRLGNYVLDAPLGAGGMAEVFRAHTLGAEGFQRPVAIKRILPDASKNPAFAEMFIAEAKLSARLQHPNIVSVLDFNRDDEGRLYLVMELVEGRDLNDVIDSGRLPYSLVIYTISEMLRGLGYAHDLPMTQDGLRGLVHRDVSPHNVLCSWNGAVKVSDFGIAKARAATAASASIMIKGKPAYMSPEQVNGAPLDGRSDLFAVGIMLWQMLTGRYLFAEGTTSETLGRVLFAEVALPRTIVADVPADLEAVTMRLLERDPARRFASAEEAIEALLACQHAPRDGRRELEQLLVARFPERAPVRTGQRMRAAMPSPPNELPQGTPAQPQPGRWGTVPHPIEHTSPATPAAIARTGPTGRRTALVVAGAVVAALAGLVIVLVASGGKSGEPGVAADAAGGQPASSDAVIAVPADARTSPADASNEAIAAPIDAGSPVDATPAADGRRRDRPPKSNADAGSQSGGIHVIPMGENDN